MYRILLVDDETLIREGVSENVPWEEHGYQFAGSCENGKEALEFIRNNPVDVVLTDICMPYMDGMQLSERLCREYPQVKIIILSGYDEFEYAKKAIQYSVKEYLLKPITSQEMCEALDRLKHELDKEYDSRKKISRMKANYHKGQLLVYSDVMNNLITGRSTEEECKKELKELGVRLNSSVFRVAVLEIDIYRRTDRLDEGAKKESALMAFVLHNISQEIVGIYGAGEVCQGKEQRTFILFHSNRPVEFRQTVKVVCNEIITQMNRIMQLAVNAGLGSYTNQLKDIYLSYEEADEALRYSYSMGGNQILEMERIRREKGQADTSKIIERILLHMKENNSRKLEEDFAVLENLQRDFLYDRIGSENISREIIDRADEIIRIAEQKEVLRSANKEDILENVLAAGNLEEAMDILCAYCIQVGELIDCHKNVGGKKYAVLAMDYLEKNYDDCSLNLHSVSSYLNISTSRFSSIFKTATGTTFMEVLIHLRMQKAKELLEHTDMKNYEIAEKVGFNDPHYFSIAFKKIMGKSPTEYAKEMRK